MKSSYYDVIIVGGSYSGLAAGMALGRAKKKVLIIDGGEPCNRQSPHSHNFLTQDGNTPSAIAGLGKAQLQQYETISFLNELAVGGRKSGSGFEIQTSSGKIFMAKKLIFATGIRDIMLPIEGFSMCWGISVLHCPYCHGYEVRNEKTGILANGPAGFELSQLISNWTANLTLYTNGKCLLAAEQADKLKQHHIGIVEKEVARLEHVNGYVQNIVFKDGPKAPVSAIYTRAPFEQHSSIPQILGCELTGDGYIKIDPSQETTVSGVFACGDNATRMRTVANAVAMGTTAGMTASRKIIYEEF